MDCKNGNTSTGEDKEKKKEMEKHQGSACESGLMLRKFISSLKEVSTVVTS